MRVLEIILILLCLSGGIVHAGPASIDISGSWKLNSEDSDDPRDVIERMQARARESRGPGNPGAGLSSSMVKRLLELGAARQYINIVQRADTVSLEYSKMFTQKIIPDGEEREMRTPEGTFSVYASWSDFELVIRRVAKDGRALTRTYRINDAGQLEVATRIRPPRSREPIKLIAVYDLQE